MADKILERSKYALTQLPTHANPYLEYILTGNFTRNLPHYLQPENYPKVKENLDGLVLFKGMIQDAVEGEQVDGYNLSDIFEYLDPALCEEVYRALLDRANPGARFAYWNMLAPRKCPESLADQVQHLDAFSDALFKKDLAWFYSAFVVEEKR